MEPHDTAASHGGPKHMARRLENLGTETAYAVSAQTKAYAALGKTVYNLHIGDINLNTPACAVDAAKQALTDGFTRYSPAAGIPELRKALAKKVSASHGVTYGEQNVIVQPGGKPVIQKLLLSYMEPGDEVIFPSPGYPIYESLINFYGGVAVPYAYEENAAGTDFHIDIAKLRALFTRRTRLFIFNDHHNPTGTMSSLREMQQVAELCVEHDVVCLSDEAYFDIVFGGRERLSIVAMPGMLERTVILYTFSKSYAMTGWRLGAAIGPKHIIDVFAKLATNDEGCVTHFNQYGAIAALQDGDAFVAELVRVLEARRDLLHRLINGVVGFHAPLPPSSFYMFVNATQAMRMCGTPTYEAFRKLLLEETGLSFCTREHFGASLPGEQQRYIRFAYSSITEPEIIVAMASLDAFMRRVERDGGVRGAGGARL